MRAPRPWAASLQRPATKILFAGGLTLAGWLLGAALTGSTASAAEAPTCPEAPVASTVDHAAKPLLLGRHRKSHHETDAAACPAQPKADTAEPTPTAPAAEATKDTEAPQATSAPATETTKDTRAPATAKATSSGGLVNGLVGGTLNALGGVVGTTKDTTTAAPAGGDLVGGLVGGVLDVVGGTVSTVTGILGTVTDTLSHTVLAPLTQPSPGNPNAPVLLPLDDVLGPVLGSSNSGGATATAPVVTTVVTQTPAAVVETAPATDTTTAADQQTTRFAGAHPVVRHAQSLPAVQDQPRDSGTHATSGGGGSTPGLPGGTTYPSAPALTATPGHDGSGGARHAFAVHTDDVTTTQLKLIGTSRDHEVDGAGRDAALPTTSPD
ncbi:hypothetical protein [Amycolatopsis sp. NPDC004625]|uniref:hypothetical protein n=1 Tax=Amycolatopsis sp. NPDC004625 TaxID=3154670 RepID=UPI0033B84A4C